MSDKLQIVCEEMVCLPVGNGVHQNVIFKPTKATSNAIRDAVREGQFMDLAVKDGGGDHTSLRPHRLLAAREVRTVLIVTSQEL